MLTIYLVKVAIMSERERERERKSSLRSLSYNNAKSR